MRFLRCLQIQIKKPFKIVVFWDQFFNLKLLILGDSLDFISSCQNQIKSFLNEKTFSPSILNKKILMEIVHVPQSLTKNLKKNFFFLYPYPMIVR